MTQTELAVQRIDQLKARQAATTETFAREHYARMVAKAEADYAVIRNGGTVRA